MDEAVQLAFELSRTDFAKGPPSATGIHQSWDRNTSFRDCKKGMKTVTQAGTDTSNPILASNMKAAIKALKSEHPEIIMSSANESKIIKAAETLSFVQKNGYVNSRKHVIGFEVGLKGYYHINVQSICTSLASNLNIPRLSLSRSADSTSKQQLRERLSVFSGSKMPRCA